ncbi:MAG: SPASM domain-containing protein [Nitrospinota bacterium]
MFFQCCYVIDEQTIFGDLLHESFQEIWTNSKYRFSGSLFVDEKYTGPEISTICSICKNFKKKQK